MPRLEWSYIENGQWAAISNKLAPLSYLVNVTGEGKFDVWSSDSKLIKGQRSTISMDFATLGLAKSWCQDCEDHLGS